MRNRSGQRLLAAAATALWAACATAAGPALAAPVALTASPLSSSAIAVRWSGGPVVLVERSASPDFSSPYDARAAAGASGFDDEGLPAGRSFFYRVRSTDGAWSATAVAGTLVGAPTIVEAPAPRAASCYAQRLRLTCTLPAPFAGPLAYARLMRGQTLLATAGAGALRAGNLTLRERSRVIAGPCTLLLRFRTPAGTSGGRSLPAQLRSRG